MADYLVEARSHNTWQQAVEDKDLTTSPAASKGDRYIVAGTGGDWSGGAVDDIAQYDGADWTFYTPVEGWIVLVKDEDIVYYFDGANWIYLEGILVGNTLVVGPNRKYTTIQGAMDVVSPGDTILAAEGTYTEAITFTQDNITLKALGSKKNTIITKSNATVVEFSTKEGCVLEGFTIKITSVGGLTVHAIAGNSDTADDTPNIIRDCDIIGTTTNNDFWMIHFADGTYHFIGCRFDANNTTGVNSHTAILLNTAICNLEIRDCYFDVDGAQTGAGLASTLYLDGVAHTVSLYNNHFDVVGSSTGDTKCIVILNGSVVDSYSNIYYSHNEDGNQVWAQITSGSTLNSYGDHILDGALLNAGTFNCNHLIDKDGIITNSKNSGCKAALASDQLNLVSGVWTKVLLDSETYDVQNEFVLYTDTPATQARFTAKKEGYYQVNGAVGWHGDSIVADKRYVAVIYRNGTGVAVSNSHTALATYCSTVVSDIIHLAANDYVELYALSIADVDTVDIFGAVTYTYMSIAKIR